MLYGYDLDRTCTETAKSVYYMIPCLVSYNLEWQPTFRVCVVYCDIHKCSAINYSSFETSRLNKHNLFLLNHLERKMSVYGGTWGSWQAVGGPSEILKESPTWCRQSTTLQACVELIVTVVHIQASVYNLTPNRLNMNHSNTYGICGLQEELWNYKVVGMQWTQNFVSINSMASTCLSNKWTLRCRE